MSFPSFANYQPFGTNGETNRGSAVSSYPQAGLPPATPSEAQAQPAQTQSGQGSSMGSQLMADLLGSSGDAKQQLINNLAKSGNPVASSIVGQGIGAPTPGVSQVLQGMIANNGSAFDKSMLGQGLNYLTGNTGQQTQGPNLDGSAGSGGGIGAQGASFLANLL